MRLNITTVLPPLRKLRMVLRIGNDSLGRTGLRSNIQVSQSTPIVHNVPFHREGTENDCEVSTQFECGSRGRIWRWALRSYWISQHVPVSLLYKTGTRHTSLFSRNFDFE